MMKQVSLNKSTAKTWICLSIIAVEIVFQIIGLFLYDKTPSWVWTICDSSLFMIPLLLGLAMGIICCIPNVICELIWYFKDVDKYKGALMHTITIFLMVIILGLLKRLLDKKKIRYSIIYVITSFEIALLLERLSYIGLRILVGASESSYLTWENVSVNFLSWGNLIMLLICGAVYIYRYKKSKAY